MIKVIDYDPSITRCDPPKKIRYDRTDFIADTESDISAMNSSNSEYLNYPAGSSVLCLGNGKWYLLNAECNEYLEFKEGGSARTKANLYRSMVSDNGEILVTLDDEIISDGMNVLSIGDTVTITVTADSGYQVKSITISGEVIENGAEITVEGDITLIAEFEEAHAPSGYTWDGVTTTEKDIRSSSYIHFVDDNCNYSKDAYIGSTVTIKEADGTSHTKTFTEDEIDYDIEESSDVFMFKGRVSDYGYDNFTPFMVVRGLSTDYGIEDGLYFYRIDESGGSAPVGTYTSSLTLSE